MRTAAFAALVAGASAFAPMMSMDMGRRQAVQAAGAAVVAAPLLRPEAASARGADGKENGAFAADSYKKYQKGYPRNIAPIIEVFEELGCSRPKTDYKGPLDGTYNDNLCIKVKGRAIAADIRKAEAVFAKVRN